MRFKKTNLIERNADIIVLQEKISLKAIRFTISRGRNKKHKRQFIRCKHHKNDNKIFIINLAKGVAGQCQEAIWHEKN